MGWSASRGGAAGRLYAFEDSLRLAADLGAVDGLAVARVTVHRFPDRETLVRVPCPVGPAAVLVRSLADPNGKLVETALAADALRRAGARRVTLVAPYLPYMRQDAVFRPGEPVSQRVVGAWLAELFDSVLTVEAHLHRIRRLAEVVSPGSVSISAAPVLAEWVGAGGAAPLVVGPDEESEPWVKAIARRAKTPWVVGRKRRQSDRTVRVEFPPLPGGARAVLVDDIASSGATLAAAARALRRAGVRTVDAAVVHALFAPGALARIRAAGVRRIVSCDTIPHRTNAIRTAPLLADALRGRSK